MSSKQMARTVLDGRKVTFTWPQAQHQTSVEGYLCGMDDFHWMVVTADCKTHLVHKGQTPLISFGFDRTYESEPNRSKMEKIIGPFRLRLAEMGLIRSQRVPATPEGLTA